MLTLTTLSQWIPIARRFRSAKDATWVPLPDAPLSLEQAQKEREAGRLLTALKYDALAVTVVMRRPAAGGEA